MTAALSGFLTFLLFGIHIPLLLFPLLTWAIGGLVVVGRSDSFHVQSVAFLLAVVGWLGLFWLYFMPLVPQPNNVWWEAARWLATSSKHAITELNGNNLIWTVSLEIGFVEALIGLSGTDQDWIRHFALALAIGFGMMLALGFIVLAFSL